MTVYKTDFSEYTTDAAPSDWTEQWGTAATLTVKADATKGFNGKYLEYLQPSDTWTGFTWDNIDSDANRDNVEILMLAQHSSTTLSGTMFGPMVRSSGTSTTMNGYLAGAYSDTALAITSMGTLAQSVSNSVVTDLTDPISTHPHNSNLYQTDRYWKRMRVNGSSIKIKFWSSLIPEPDNWDVEVTDTGVTGVGAVGLCTHNDSGDPFKIYYYCVATNGDTAEYPDRDTSAEIRVSSAPLQVLVQQDGLPMEAAQSIIEVLSHTYSAVEAAQTIVEVLHTLAAAAPPSPVGGSQPVVNVCG